MRTWKPGSRVMNNTVPIDYNNQPLFIRVAYLVNIGRSASDCTRLAARALLPQSPSHKEVSLGQSNGDF